MISEFELIEMERRALKLHETARKSRVAIERNQKRGEVQYFSREEAEQSVACDVLALVELLRKCRDNFPYPHPVTVSEYEQE